MRQVMRRLFLRLRAAALSPFRPSRLRICQVTSAGHRLLVLVNEDIGWSIVTGQPHEEMQLSLLESLLRETDLFFDVGAHVGLFTIRAATQLRLGRVIAFEPVPLSAALLRTNALLNGLTNVDVYELALADKEGLRELLISSDAAFSSLRDTGRRAPSGAITVRTTTIDTFCMRRTLRPSVIKIDSEGAEMLVLRGAERTLTNGELRPRVLLIELSPINLGAFGTSPEAVVRFMEQRGYRTFTLTRLGLVPGYSTQIRIQDVLFADRHQVCDELALYVKG